MRRLVPASLLIALLAVPSLAAAQSDPEPAPEPPPLPPADPGQPEATPVPPPAPTPVPPPQGQPAYPPYGAQPAYPYPPYPGYGPPPPPPPPPPRLPPPTRDVSLTVSPIHLVFPILEVSAELRAHDAIGVSLIGGYGQISTTGLFETKTYDVYELGGQLSFYPLEPFESLLLGVELLWLQVDSDDLDRSFAASAAGVAVGPMMGYKYIADGGFTLFVQGGAQYVAARAEAADGSSTETAEDRAFIPMVNFNLGWSF